MTGWEREEPRRRKTGTRRHLTCLPTRQSSLRARSSAGSTSGYFHCDPLDARSFGTAYERSFSSPFRRAFTPRSCFPPCLFGFFFFFSEHERFARSPRVSASGRFKSSIGGLSDGGTETVSTRGSPHLGRSVDQRPARDESFGSRCMRNSVTVRYWLVVVRCLWRVRRSRARIGLIYG